MGHRLDAEVKMLENQLMANVQSGAGSYNRGRAGVAGSTYNGNRDMYSILGYPFNPTISNFVEMYNREGVAFRAVNAFGDATWTDIPTVQDDGDTENVTQFEQDFLDLSKRLKLFHYMNKSDKLTCLGRYSIMLIGVSGNKDLKTPLKNVENGNSVVYLRPYSESSVVIKKWDEVASSSRYGLPEMYTLHTGGLRGMSGVGGGSMDVHWSRILHFAKDTLDNDVFGTPLLKPIYNRLIDLEKVLGGSSEAFWSNARGGLHVNVTDAKQQIKDLKKTSKDIEEYSNNLRRAILTIGMDVKPINMLVHSPVQHVRALMENIAGALSIPQRILTGSEQGQLASGQDKNNWDARVIERRQNFCEPMMLRAFIDRMMEIDALPTVPEYEVVWPELVSQSAKEAADVAFTIVKTADMYTKGRAGELVAKEQVTDALGIEFKKDDVMEADDEPLVPVPPPVEVATNVKKKGWFRKNS